MVVAILEAELAKLSLLVGRGSDPVEIGVVTCGARTLLVSGDFTGVLGTNDVIGAATGGDVKHCSSNVTRQTTGNTALQHSKLVFDEISQSISVSRKS